MLTDIRKMVMEVNEYLDNSELIEETDDYKKFLIHCDDGYGYMTSYHPLEGIWVVINDFHASTISEQPPYLSKRYLEINHCLKGRFECVFKNNRYAYLGEGDLSMNDWTISRHISSFPLGYYYGIELLIDLEEASCLPFIQQFHIDLSELFVKVKNNHKLLIIRSTERIQHIFWEMYNDQQIWEKDYLKIKIAELLFFICFTSYEKDSIKHCYTKGQTDKVKKIKQYLEEHYAEKFTIESLSEKYDINIATLRKCFKDIYGKPLYKWHKEYRLQIAKELLENSDISIIEVAYQIGYDNPSKFSAAFAKQFGKTPLLYRKTHQ